MLYFGKFVCVCVAKGGGSCLLFCVLVPGVIWLVMEALACWTPVRDLLAFTK